MPYGYKIQAEYSDGYNHTEDEQDHSPWVSGKNILSDIIEGRPEKGHGKMVRFSLVGINDTHNIDWSEVPKDARPIYYREMQLIRNVSTGNNEVTCLKHYFGYQWTENNKNHKEIKEII